MALTIGAASAAPTARAAHFYRAASATQQPLRAAPKIKPPALPGDTYCHLLPACSQQPLHLNLDRQ